MKAKRKVVQKEIEHASITIFKYVFSNFPLDAIACAEEDPETFKERVRYVYQQLEEKQCDILKSRRFVNDAFILEIPIDRKEAETANFTACIKAIEISRVGAYTCPIKTLLVFTSESFIDVTDSVLNLFNDLLSEEDVKGIVDGDDKLQICPKIESLGYEHIEFKPTESKLKPIAWVNFTDNTESKAYEAKINLQGKFCGNFLYVKFICPENRRAEIGWEHENMNIDCTWVLPRGKIISFED